MAMAGAAGRCLMLTRPSPLLRLRLLRAALATTTTTTTAAGASAVTAPTEPETTAREAPSRHELLLERLRQRHLKGVPAATPRPAQREKGRGGGGGGAQELQQKRRVEVVDSFEELGLGEEVMAALGEMGISKPTEIQCVGVPAVLAGTSVVLGSHTGSGKTLAYLLPLVQVCCFSSWNQWSICICVCTNVV
jgi:ATP-dependent helicase YprA (DUF1998 family)